MRFWLGASLLVALIYGIWGCRESWGEPYEIQDDARQHLFWMQRFLDPELFPQDLIADYFQSVAPWGYTRFYQLFASLGIDPLQLSKLLPIGLGILGTLYGFRLCLQFLPMPFTGFLAALLLNQVFWSHDDLASATPRAFMPPLFLAFLYYLLRRALWPCLVTIVLEGLFYPQYVLVFAGILCLQPVCWQRGVKLTSDREVYRFCLAGLATAILVMLPYLLIASPYGPVITAAAARQLPDFYSQGRGRFFLEDPWTFWLSGNRSGIFPTLKPPILGLGVLLPLLLMGLPRRLLLARYITRKAVVLVQVSIVAFALFFAAHALLFKLHLPSRYTAYTLRFVLTFATALSLSLLLESGLRWLQQQPAKSPRQVFVWGITLCLSTVLLLYPAYAEGFPNTGYEKGRAVALYEFLAEQPKDILVASLLKEADNLPSFAKRSVLVAPEYQIPYHVGYANRFRQRAIDLIQAQYTLNSDQLRQFIQTYGIDFWLIDRNSFKADTFQNQWIRQYPAAITTAIANLKQAKPIVQQRVNRCTVLQDKEWRLLRAECLVD